MRKLPYHVFVYTHSKDVHPKGGLHDCVCTEETLEKAHIAVDQCAGIGKSYQIAVVDPADMTLTIVERGGFSTNPRRHATEIGKDPLTSEHN